MQRETVNQTDLSAKEFIIMLKHLCKSGFIMEKINF